MQSKTVLIAEDEPAIAGLLKFLLESNGYMPAVAYNGEEVIKSVKANRPNLILLDIMLPIINGYSVQKQLQMDEQTANIPTIILTAKDGMRDLFHFEKNVVAYIEKPFDPKVLLEKIEEALKDG